MAALPDGRLSGAALDVFRYGANTTAELLSLESVVLNPHIASATHETRRAMGDLMLDNLNAFFTGR